MGFSNLKIPKCMKKNPKDAEKFLKFKEGYESR